jgi:hypothetical protein
MHDDGMSAERLRRRHARPRSVPWQPKDRNLYEIWAWIFFVAALAASSFSATKDYALLEFLFGGILAYRAIMCRFEESTIESMSHKWDLDCVLELLLENRQRELEERREELQRLPTDAELARRGNIIRGMEKRFEAHRLRAGRRADLSPSRRLSSSC